MEVWKYKGDRGESKHSLWDSYILFVSIELRYIDVINTHLRKRSEKYSLVTAILFEEYYKNINLATVFVWVKQFSILQMY